MPGGIPLISEVGAGDETSGNGVDDGLANELIGGRLETTELS